MQRWNRNVANVASQGGGVGVGGGAAAGVSTPKGHGPAGALWARSHSRRLFPVAVGVFAAAAVGDVMVSSGMQPVEVIS